MVMMAEIEPPEGLSARKLVLEGGCLISHR